VAELLRCADRWHREVVLFEDTWYDKIVADHAEVAADSMRSLKCSRIRIE
jgi:hypothetical protein